MRDLFTSDANGKHRISDMALVTAARIASDLFRSSQILSVTFHVVGILAEKAGVVDPVRKKFDLSDYCQIVLRILSDLVRRQNFVAAIENMLMQSTSKCCGGFLSVKLV